MDTQIEAVYENGVFRPLQPLTLAEHERVLLTVSPCEDEDCEKTLAAIRAGLEDIKAGKTLPYDDFDRQFRAKHGLPPRA